MVPSTVDRGGASTPGEVTYPQGVDEVVWTSAVTAGVRREVTGTWSAGSGAGPIGTCAAILRSVPGCHPD